MTRPKDTNALTADDLRLVDLLYGELEGEEEAAALALVEEDPGAASELEALRGVRAMMAELPEEEPPPAISAQLLHAAAKQAKGARPAVSDVGGVGFVAWLKRFFQPMAMHPAMAAAATFVLVAGVAGALYVSGRVSVPEPHAPATPAESADRTVAAAGEESADPAEPATTEAGRRVQFDEDVLVDEKAAAELPAASPTPTGGEDYREGRLGGKPPAKKSGAVRRRASAKPDGKREGPGFGYSDSFGAGGGAESNTPPADPAPRYKMGKGKKKKPAKAARPPVLSGAAGDSGLIDGKEQESELLEQSTERDQRVNQARAWHQKAVKAATDGECDAVIEIGQRVRKLDSRYYDTVYLRDKRLFACRRGTAPNTEK